MILTFFNKFGETVTEQQSALLPEYSISYSAPNGIVKREETYINGLLQWVDYFREADEGEEEARIAAKEISPDNYRIKTREVVGTFIITNTNVYLDDVLTRKSRTLTDVEGKLICDEKLDMETMLPIYESTLKFLNVFETGPDASYCKFHYNQDGSFWYCEYNYMDEYDYDEFEIDRLPWIKDKFQLSDAEYNYYLTAELYPLGLI